MTKLVITIDLDKRARPATDELDEWGLSELDWWCDLAYTDPPLVFDGAYWELIEEDDDDRSC